MRYRELLAEEKLNGFTIVDLPEFVQKDTAQPDDADEEDDTPEVEIDGEDNDDDELEDNGEFSDEEDGATHDDLLGEAFGLGSKHRVASDDEMQDYLDRTKKGKKGKLDKYNMPYIHNKVIKIVDGEGVKYDLEDLKRKIMQRPTTLLKQNEKIKHSNGKGTQYYNMGLPALKGLAVNEETGEFVIVTTCPSAGLCKTLCYAMKGSYVMFPDTSIKQTQTLNFLLNDPEGFKNEAKKEIEKALRMIKKKYPGTDTKLAIRWHDSGDFFSPEYKDLAFSLAEDFPDVDFYAYTKMADVAKADKPENFKINFSGGALSSEEKKIDFVKIKHAIIVPKELFYGKLKKDDAGKWQWISDDAEDEFKQALSDKYKIKKETIRSIEEFEEMDPEEKGTKMYWNIYIRPGSSDSAANSNAVLGSYLLFH